ncbi:LamG-like jellyroll fold domain-containing protein [Salegentibacter agarivorans]
MGKITPRFFLAVFIFGLYLLSVNTVLANINYGPDKSLSITEDKKQSFFVGFYLDMKPSISLEEEKPATCDDTTDGALSINVSGGEEPYTYTWSGPGDGSSLKNSPSIDNLGAGEYYVTVTDATGEQDDASFDVTVEDSKDPLVATRDIYISLNSSGTNSIQAIEIDNGSTDNCGIENITISKESFTCDDVGDNIVTLTVTDVNGNSASKTATVKVQDNIEPEVVTKNITVQLDESGQANIIADDIDNGSNDICGIQSTSLDTTSFDCNNIGENTVTLTVTDINGNSDSKTATVTVEDKIAPQVITQDITVQLDENGTASITADQIDNGSNDTCGIQSISLDITSFDCTDIGENNVTLTVTDKNDNSNTGTSIVTVEDNIKPILPTVNDITWGCEYTVEVPIAEDNCDTEITGVADRSTTFSEPGEHTINWTFTDASGNSSSIQQTVTIEALQAEIETVNIDCFGFDNGSAEVIATGGVGNLIYHWEYLPENESSWQNISGNGTSQVNLPPDDYRVTVSDQNGCFLELAFTISQPDELQMADPTSTPVSCFEGSDGTISAGTVSGGTVDENGNYQYSIDNENWNTSGEFSNVEAGNHTIFVKDANNCALQVTVNVEEPDILNATINKTDVNCYEGEDGSISLTNLRGGSGDYEFSVDGNTWNIATQAVEGLSAGSYEVQIRDTNATDCIIVLNEAYQINQPEAALQVGVNTTRTTAYGTSTASATANPSGGTAVYTYEWRRNGNNEILYSTKNVSGLSAGNYNLTVYDRNNCMIVEEFTIYDAVEAQIVATSLCLTADDELRTSRFEVDLSTVVGGVGTADNFNYNWDFGVGATPQTAIGPDRTEVAYTSAGDKTITLTITDEAEVETELIFYQYVGACFESCGTTSNFIISEEGFFIGDADGNPISGQDCADTAEKYLWIDIEKSSNGYSLSAEIEYTINDGSQTNARRAVGCFSELISGTPGGNGQNKPEYAIIPVGLFRLFKVEASSNDDSIVEWECGQEFSVEQINIRWTNNSNRGCGENPQNMCVGLSDEVDVSTPIIASYEKEDVLCFGQETGSIFINATGGIRPYQYSISGDTNSNYFPENRFFDIPAGIYSEVWVKDSKGNKYQLPEIKINQPDAPVTAEILVTDPLCYGETGTASIEATGGTPFEDGTYEYLWNDPNNQTTQEATGLSEGTYTVTVIDANGCQIIEEVIITEPEQLTVADAGADQDFNCGFNTTILSANTPEKGLGKWTIKEGPTGGEIVNDTLQNSEFNGSPGIYTLVWTISNEDETCQTSDEVQITFIEDCSTLDFDGQDDHVYLGDNFGFISGNFSIEAWIRPKSVNNTRTIFSKRNTKDLGKGFDLIINSGAPTFRWGNKSVSTSHKVTANRWHHIAAIYNNGELRLYVDGLRVGTATATNPTALEAPALIGAMYNEDTPDLPVNYFHGWIEEVRLWGRALSEEQLRFMMNQRLIVNQSPVQGDILPMDVPGNLNWDSLKGYLQMKVTESGNGTTPNVGEIAVAGELRNIETSQQNTAPLPYESEATGTWHNKNSWDPNSSKFWTFPNDKGINGNDINWNIAIHKHNLNSNNKDIKLLGLFNESGKNLEMLGDNNQSGNELRITHYLKLDGVIDLDGESQLIQTDISEANPKQTVISILEESSIGYVERDQQGTENSYNYNYWTSPVSTQGSANNSGYTIKGIMKDGTNSKNPQNLSFAYAHTHADDNYSGDKRISSYWLHKFRGTANSYGEWRWVGENNNLQTGEGFTMKGTSGSAPITNNQNYVFQGKPNNGTITLNISNQENRLVGNPYPSAIDADQFIRDNLKDVDGGNRNRNVFNGALYFWDHFGQEDSHVLREYVGGYATYNLAGGAPAASSDFRINNSTNKTGNKTPGRYIPVAQGFFVNSVLDEALSGNYTIDGGDITFRNRQRVFVKEASSNSQFLKPENAEKVKTQVEQAKYTEDNRYKIRLNFHSPKGYHRQILVTADSKTTNEFDLGYDAPLIDNNVEDMFWVLQKSQFVIQAVPHFNLDQRLPIGLKISEEKEFSIEIGELENVPDIIDIYLRDNSDSTYHDLRKEAFKATLPAGEYQDLYEIVFQDVTSTREDKEPGEGPIDYFYSMDEREFVIRNPELHEIEHINIYNITGQLVDQHFGIPDIKEIHIPQKKSLSSGVYIVKIYTSAGDYAKKVIIRKD